jgi:hypothetical protein
MKNQEITKSTILAQEKGNFIIIKRFSQYAEGITGCNHSMTILTKDGIGFATKKEAREVFKELKAKSPDRFKNVKGTSSPYGNVGCVQYDIKFVSRKDIEPLLDFRSIYTQTYGRI